MLDITSSSVTINKQLEGFLSEPENIATKGIIIHLHGFPGGPRDQYELHKLFCTRGYKILTINYPGLWGVEGIFSIESAFQAANNTLQWVLDNFSDLEIYFFGESFGGLMATAIAAHNDISTKLALRAPVPSLDMFREDVNPVLNTQMKRTVSLLQDQGILVTDLNLWYHPDDEKIYDKLDVTSNLKKLQERGIDIKVIVGKNDEILSYDLINKIYSPYAKMDVYEDLRHNLGSQEKWVELITKIDMHFQ